MATNVSYASGDSLLEALVTHTLPQFGPQGDGIIENNLLLSYLKANDRFEVVDGGLEFWSGIIKAENSNFKWQGHTDTMTAALQDPTERLRYPIKTFTGAVVINKLHEAQNKGRAMIKQWARTLRDQADATIKNQFNSAFWNSSPATDEPESVPNLISATPTTGTIGGLNRSGNAYLQNIAYTTAVADIGCEAGIAIVNEQKIRASITANDQPDIFIMDENLYSGMVGYLSTLNRYRPDDMMGQLGFDTIKLGNATYSYENTNVASGLNSITSGYVYGINSKYFKLKVLRDGNFKWADRFERVGQSLSKAMYFYTFCNLCTNNPKAHLVMTNVSTT